MNKTIQTNHVYGGNMKKKFITGAGCVFNDTPTSREESLAHRNALAASGNYPVGTSECFNVGISGGCGPECYIYSEGSCEEPQEMIPRLNDEELKEHMELYPEEPTNE